MSRRPMAPTRLAGRAGCVLALLCLSGAPSLAGPEDGPVVVSDLPWLPLSGDEASVRLRPGADPTAPQLAALLADGTPLRSAPIWRVPAERAAALAAHPDVIQVWGLPDPAPPPDEADLPPETPSFASRQSWRTELGVDGAAWWPGGAGFGVRIGDVEYDIDPTHEDLANNPPLTVYGVPRGAYIYHGNASVGLAAASDDGFGVTGGAPEAEVVVLHPDNDGRYDLALAIEAALDHLEAGDVLLIEQQVRTTEGNGPVTSEPGAWEAVRAVTTAGIHVVEPAGNGGVDLDSDAFDGWFGPDNDPGSILVGAVRPGTREWNGSSGHGSRVHLFADGGELTAPSHADGRTDAFFPQDDPRQAYTHRFGGTSGASAVVAGIVAAVEGAAQQQLGEPTSPSTMRQWLISTGRAQEPTSAAEHPVGVRPDARRAIRAWVAW